jgi:hypothetical protein
MPEYVGAIHIHTFYSDGGGTLRDVTAAARRAGLDFVVATDHDSLRARRDGWQGWHDGVLLVIGMEITCRDRCHVVALGGGDDIAGLLWRPLPRAIEHLRRQGTAAFIAHAHPAYMRGAPLKGRGLSTWDAADFTGVELWSFMHDICDGLTPWRLPWFLFTWRRCVRGPHPAVLAEWDRVTQVRRFAAVGALDNHAVPLLVWRKPFLSYEDSFRTVRTHVFTEELTGTAEDAARVIEALCEGRAFLALDMLADSRGFRFEAEMAGRRLGMGDERPWVGPAVLRAQSPAPAGLTLRCDGRPVAEITGTHLEFRADGPGVYRVEARYGGKPWVYTNPIYLRPASSV